MKQFHVIITGFVQGVGFRVFTVRKARKMGINGWIRNLKDGRVEAVFQGENEKIDSLLENIKKGSYFAQVKDLVIKEEKIIEKFSEMLKKETL